MDNTVPADLKVDFVGTTPVPSEKQKRSSVLQLSFPHIHRLFWFLLWPYEPTHYFVSTLQFSFALATLEHSGVGLCCNQLLHFVVDRVCSGVYTIWTITVSEIRSVLVCYFILDTRLPPT